MKLFKKLKERVYGIILLRYLLYAIGFLEILVLPKVLKNEVYALYEYNKNLVLLFPYVLLGAHNSYVYLTYTKKVDSYKTLTNIGVALSIFFGITLSLILQNFYLAIPFIFIAYFTIIEQKLKIKNKFLSAFTFKPLISVLTITLTFLSPFLILGANQLLMFSYLGAFILWYLFINKDNYFSNLLTLRISRFSVLKFIYLVKLKITDILASITLAGLFFFERFVVNKFYNNELASYSLAFNVSQILTILLSVFTYISAVKFGERINTISKNEVLQYVKKGLLAFIAAYILVSTLVVTVGPKLYDSFDNLTVISLILLLSKGFFAFSGVFTPIAFYKDYNKEMFKVLVVIFIINVATCLTLANLEADLTTILFLNNAIIVMYSLYILDIVVRRAKYFPPVAV